MPDPAFYARNAFAHHCNDMVGYTQAWCRAADIPPEERAEAVRVLIERLRDVLRTEVEW
jgi:hypothetical protein